MPPPLIEKEPHKRNKSEIVAAVMERIPAGGIWLPEQEVTKHFYRRKPITEPRIERIAAQAVGRQSYTRTRGAGSQ